MLKKLGFAVLMASLSSAALAKDGLSCKPEKIFWFTIDVCTPIEHHSGSSPASAPEIDPASAAAALTLVIGGLAVIRSRRSKTPAA